jgi:UDP-2,4-diacetamido-2,4,6-trideoxy-beta-L-altropyranose hydrolase
VSLARQLGAAWVVVDGYHFGTDYQQWIKEAGLGLLFIDDEGRGDHYYADLVLNQNIHAHEGLYGAREPYTRLLLGPRYALLRREFWPWRGWRRQVPAVARKILVTLGGGDPDNVTGKVIEALRQVKVEGLEAAVIAGGANPHFQQLEKTVGSLPFSARLKRNVTNMPELMAWADMAITAGGSTCWETAFMGLSGLVMILAENQRPVAEGLAVAGVAINLWWQEKLAPASLAAALQRLLMDQIGRSEMKRRGQALVDGEGSARVLMHLLDRSIRIRPVRAIDCRMVWEWANDPEVRAASFSTTPISWESHETWFQARLKDPQYRFYIALDADDVPVGQVRFGLQGEEATISVSVGKLYRSQGYGPILIHLGCDQLFAETSVKLVQAYIKPENPPSLKVFLKAGFTQAGPVMVHGQTALHCQRRREVRDV